jgi:hypothetical protein
MCHFERQREICLTAPSAGRAKGSYQPAARIAPYPNPFANDDTYGGVEYFLDVIPAYAGIQ